MPVFHELGCKKLCDYMPVPHEIAGCVRKAAQFTELDLTKGVDLDMDCHPRTAKTNEKKDANHVMRVAVVGDKSHGGSAERECVRLFEATQELGTQKITISSKSESMRLTDASPDLADVKPIPLNHRPYNEIGKVVEAAFTVLLAA